LLARKAQLSSAWFRGRIKQDMSAHLVLMM
jgi:hypothetical protein